MFKIIVAFAILAFAGASAGHAGQVLVDFTTSSSVYEKFYIENGIWLEAGERMYIRDGKVQKPQDFNVSVGNRQNISNPLFTPVSFDFGGLNYFSFGGYLQFYGVDADGQTFGERIDLHVPGILEPKYTYRHVFDSSLWTDIKVLYVRGVSGLATDQPYIDNLLISTGALPEGVRHDRGESTEGSCGADT